MMGRMERHDEVLGWAAAARARRNDVVAKVAAGHADLTSILDLRHDALVAPIKLVVVVQAVPHVGKVAARRLLARLALEEKRVGDLTDGQAAALLAAAGEPGVNAINVAGG